MKYLWTPWAGWGAAVLALLLFLIPRPVTVKTEYRERVVTRTVMKAQVLAKEGSTTTITPNGTTVITGPAEIKTEAESSTSKSVDSTTTSSYAKARWSAGAILMSPSLSPRPAWGGTVGYRLLGPLWVEGQVVMREALPDVGIVVRLTF